jgi:hypothetical protein
MRLYNAEISAGSLLVAESRRIAVLMLGKPTDAEWESAIKEENILQKTPATARRQAQLLRNRLSTLDDAGLIMVAEESSELCRQILMAAAMRHSRLMSDFMRDVYIDDLRRLERTLSHRQWDEFLLEDWLLDLRLSARARDRNALVARGGDRAGIGEAKAGAAFRDR